MSSRPIKIDGRQYELEIVGLADRFVERYQTITRAEIAQIFCIAMDGGRLTKRERDSFEFVKRNYRLEPDARELLNFLLAQAKEAATLPLKDLEVKEREYVRKR